MTPEQNSTVSGRLSTETLPVSADRIEERLSEYWQAARADDSSDKQLVRLSLANILIICDESSHKEAVRLVRGMAVIQPSRVICVLIDDNVKHFCSHVSTACDLSRQSDSKICWEIIEIESDHSHADKIPSAVRSLLVDSVPVITIDFRPAQNEPKFDAIVSNLSDYYFVNAELVPIGKPETHFLPLRWYRTLPIRELFSQFFSRMQKELPMRIPVEFTFYPDNQAERLDVLVGGWIIHRLGGLASLRKRKKSIEFDHMNNKVTMIWSPDESSESHFARIRFDDKSVAEISSMDGPEGEKEFSLSYRGINCQYEAKKTDLEAYIIESTRNSVEFLEYEAVRQVVIKTAIG